MPACPGWTVHDVVAHLAGIVDDALHGRLDGVATEPWTAAQVEGRGATSAQLLAQWAAQAPAFESASLPPQAVADVACHEQDIRNALERPGDRENDEYSLRVELLAQRAVEEVPGLRVESDGTAFGPVDAYQHAAGRPLLLLPGDDGPAVTGPAAGLLPTGAANRRR